MAASEDTILYARVTRADIKPSKLDNAVSLWKEALTSHTQTAGFVAAYLLVDRAARSGLAVSLWESREHAEKIDAERRSLGDLTKDLTAPAIIEADKVPVRTARIEPAAHARVTAADIKGLSRIESGIIWHDALPEYERIPGFQGAFMLQAIHSPRGMVITFWKDEDTAKRTSESGMRTAVLSRFVVVMAGPPTVEGFQVLLQI